MEEASPSGGSCRHPSMAGPELWLGKWRRVNLRRDADGGLTELGERRKLRRKKSWR